ncbi:hypothetical protein [Halomicrobium sp. LC1Hm]|mgnify:CR=1 FL=1|uniref:hypothetical protein n=1 Tax=Halomicrobium sp. LC1Hm TaxID=2610902 RepID=UPI0012983464|nr:hypothetical protein [Halomicrobium sp. LC1Hm]QGA81806.1 hypothetical protein LC1Hm_0743 [Halomicrobium sp. LC1Hm]
MEPQFGSGVSIRLIQVFVLIFAGFATMLLRIYGTDVDDMEAGSPEMLAWFFMSYAIVPVYPAFLLSLVPLLRDGSVVTTYIGYLLGLFVTLPTLVLTLINLYVGVTDGGDIALPLYQRVTSSLSTVLVWTSTFVVTILYVCPEELPMLVNRCL